MSLGRRNMRSRSKSQYRSRFERLEPRCCPSASPAASITTHNHTLNVSDSNVGDTITVTDDGAGNINVTITNGTTAVANGSGTGIRSVRISVIGGGDTVNYTYGAPSAGGTGTATVRPLSKGSSKPDNDNDESISMNLRGGGNTATLDFSAGISNADLGIDVDASGGKNNVTEIIGALTSAHLDDSISGHGSGGDTFDATLSGNLSVASRALVSVDGEGGGDTLGLHVKGDIAADSLLAAYVGGGGSKGGDTIAFDYIGALNGKLFASADGRGGNETITQSVTINQGSMGKLFTDMHAGKGSTPNKLTLTLTDNSGGTGNASTLDSVNALIIQQPGDTVTQNVSANDTSDVQVITQKGWGWGWLFG
jgi:hypothetical protein